ncbi:hypothetical protein O7626_18840 [Micromonospora sp. WMMD1102]|uniref:hypothetical protein n=1 Tax=Micromonospora sp. WMMD1102 TaxID=3016105 RepID=UPI0024155356|nr:hypothetical protein [Micromonospora sp. WMMD1102]MDG4787971.1 hypothetical protein [Micromonospora sp. WMMD1102]
MPEVPAAVGPAVDPVADEVDLPVAERVASAAEPDILLDVPQLSVEKIRLSVHGLDADLSLRTRLANLLQIDAGVRVHLEEVDLDIEGVEAEALLKVRLDQLAGILNRALSTIDRNPAILGNLLRTADNAVGEVNRTARDAVTGLDRAAEQALGWQAAATRAIDRSAGSNVPPSGPPVTESRWSDVSAAPAGEAVAAASRSAADAVRAGEEATAAATRSDAGAVRAEEAVADVVDRPTAAGTGRRGGRSGQLPPGATAAAARAGEVASGALRAAGGFLRNAVRDLGLETPPSRTGEQRASAERSPSPGQSPPERNQSAAERTPPVAARYQSRRTGARIRRWR